MSTPRRQPQSVPLAHHLSSAFTLLQQPPPPSLREIVAAYRTRSGSEDDRELLIAMLNAKSSEDQRIATVASLHRTVLELHQPPIQLAPIHIPSASEPNPHYHHTAGLRRKRDADEEEDIERTAPTKRARRASPQNTHLPSLRWRGPPSPSESEMSYSSSPPPALRLNTRLPMAEARAPKLESDDELPRIDRLR